MTYAPLQIHAVRLQTGEADLPEDRFSNHVNNARYFAFINTTFQSWYRATGLRGGIPDIGAPMAHLEYDFRSEVRPPSWIECRIEVTRVGRASMEHAIEIHDLGLSGDGPRRLAGQGRAVHVCLDRKTRKSCPWPSDLIARCFTPPQNTPG
jgi:acyl-CoA thioesterase FadM